MEKKITITLTEKEVKYILLAATALKYDASLDILRRVYNFVQQITLH